MPQRIQRKRVKGWRLPEKAKIVDRSSRYGNPIAVRQRDVVIDGENVREWVVFPIRDLPNPTLGIVSKDTVLARFATRAEAHVDAVRRYKLWLPESGLDLEPLRGRDLACPCDPEYACHVDVLLVEANR